MCNLMGLRLQCLSPCNLATGGERTVVYIFQFGPKAFIGLTPGYVFSS